MRRESLEHLNLRLHGNLLAEHTYALDAVHEPPPKAPLRLIADKEHRGFRPPEVVLEVVQDTSRIRHARCR